MSTNPSAVTRILSNNGEPVSRNQPSRIRHLQEHTAGFRSERNAEGTVNLYFRGSSILRLNNDEIREKLKVAEVMLDNKGYMVERQQWDSHPYLRVEKIS